jgi:hypothetical protein
MKILLCLILLAAPPTPPRVHRKLYSPKALEQAKSLITVHKLSLGGSLIPFKYPPYDTNQFWHWDLQMSTNLVDWQTIRTNISGEQTVYTTNSPLGLYRIRGWR